MTYRWREHCGPNYDNDIGYRKISEFEEWKSKDPIVRLKNKLILSDMEIQNQIMAFENSINDEIIDAFDHAEQSPFPDPEETFRGVYA